MDQKVLPLVIVGVLVPLLSGQTKQPDAARQEIGTLKKQIADLQRKVAQLQVDKADNVAAYKVDPTAVNRYQRITTDHGWPLTISFKTAEPFLDGYKLTFEVGNPNFVTFNGYELLYAWSSSSGFRDGKASFGGELPPGGETIAEIVISPLTAAAVKSVSIWPEVNVMRMGR